MQKYAGQDVETSENVAVQRSRYIETSKSLHGNLKRGGQSGLLPPKADEFQRAIISAFIWPEVGSCLRARHASARWALNLSLWTSVAGQLLAVLLQEVVDGFDANAQRRRGFVLVDIAETEVRLAGALGDLFDHAADEGVVSAFEVRQLHRDQVGMARRKFRGPKFVVGARRTGNLPHVGDRQCGGNRPFRNLSAEETFEQVRIERQVALRKDRIAELLERVEDSLVQPRIVMIRASQQNQADLLF